MHIFCDRNSLAVDPCCLTSLRISEVHPRGKYIRIVNSSKTKEEDLGNHFLLQRYQDTPFTVFRFPSAVCLRPLGVATVWSASGAAEESAAGRQLPPTDFVFSSQPIWASGPDCITILCKPNEQALNWLSRSPPCLSDQNPPRSFEVPCLKKDPQQTTHSKSYRVYPKHKDDLQSVCKDDPAKERQTKTSRSIEENRGRSESKSRAEKREADDCRQTSDSSPGRRTVARKKGTPANEDLEGRRRCREQSEARNKKKKEVRIEQRKCKEEEECCGCEEEIRLNSSSRRRKLEGCKEEEGQSRRRRRTGRGRGSPGGDDCGKGAKVMDKRIPCTYVHIEDQSTSSATGCKTVEGGAGGGGCVEENSDCGGDRDCAETSRPNSFGASCNSLCSSKNFSCATNDSRQDENDCGSCSESPKRKRVGHASLGRCVESRETSSKGSTRMSDCKKKKDARNVLGGGQRRSYEDCEELGPVQKKAGGGGRCAQGGGCGSEEEMEDDCGKKRKSPDRRRKCEDCVEGRTDKWNRPGGGMGCGGGGRRRRTEEQRTYEDCCGSGTDGDGSWAKWKKWLAGMVSWHRKGSICRDQPCFSSSTLDCLDQQALTDAAVTCTDQVHVREICPTYRPRLSNPSHCACSAGCPVCPPCPPGCNEQVGVAEMSRQRPVKKKMEGGKRCDCDGTQQKREATKRDGRCTGTKSEGCLTEATTNDVCDCWCHLDCVALTAASVMAAGLTVAAIYCN